MTSPAVAPRPRVVVVTGASSGIGRATAQTLAGRGDHVVLVARSVGPLQDAAGECRTAGAASARALSVDVTDAQAVADAVADVQADHGSIDAVVHSAGVVAYGRFEDVPPHVFDGVIKTNVLGSANVARAVLPQMRERDRGTLVLVGSVIGTIAVPGMSAYVLSKWGIRALARQLHLENRDRPGVHICCLSPGGVDTPIYLQAANYLGQVGRPPPPVASPERVARVAAGVLDRPRQRVNVGVTNPVITLGFTVLPGVFDALVGPLFTLAAIDRQPIEAGAGNVTEPKPGLERLHGDQGSSVRAIAGAVGERLRDRVQGRLRGR